MKNESSSDDEIDVKNENMFNYKGYFIENAEEEEEPKYFEFGAHFSYKELYNALQALKEKKIMEEKGKQIEKIIQTNKKRVTNKERNNTKIKKKDNNLNNIINIFKHKKGRSRNIGVDPLNEDNQNELTFIPKFSFKNNLSIKKEEKKPSKSLNAFKTNFNPSNYKKIYKNINNNRNINSHSNKKTNSNNKYKNKKTELNQIKKGKCFAKYILTRNRNKKNVYQQISLFPKNQIFYKENNYSCDINLQKSFQTQIKDVKTNSKKKLKIDTLPFKSFSKEKNKNIIKQSDRNKEKMNINLITKSIVSIKKRISNNKKIELYKSKNQNSINDKSKNSLNKRSNKIFSNPLEILLNSYKSKNNKYSPETGSKIFRILKTDNNKYNSSYKIKNINKNINIKDIKNISIKNNMPIKVKEHSDITDSKGIISISIDDNKKNYFNTRKTEKNKINKVSNFMSQSSFNNNITFPNISSDCLDFSNKTINKRIESKNTKDSLNYLLTKNEKNSRNIKSNFLNNNISSVNYTNNKNINTINNTNLFKTNNTQQNNNYFIYKNQEIIKNNTFVNLNNKKINDKNKKILIGIPSSSNKKKTHLSQFDNINLFNNYYSTSFINKKNKKNKINKSFLNKLTINKSKQKINLTKGFISKAKNIENLEIKNNNKLNSNTNINSKGSNNIISLGKITNSIKNNSVNIKNSQYKNQNEPKNYQSLIHKKDTKSNINISININNNNNIIYNKIINDKNNNFSCNNIKDDKSQIQKMNKSSSIKTDKKILYNAKLESRHIITNNIKNKILHKVNNNIKRDDKIKFINIKFPKAKFLNIFNNK